ncbi:MAG: hypothetical protein ACPL7J_14705, partial [Desulfomonilaceae bacterium]
MNTQTMTGIEKNEILTGVPFMRTTRLFRALKDMMAWAASKRALSLVFIAALMAGGCVIPRQRAVVPDPPVPPGKRITQHFPTALYRLAEGDTMEFLYLTVPN